MKHSRIQGRANASGPFESNAKSEAWSLIEKLCSFSTPGSAACANGLRWLDEVFELYKDSDILIDTHSLVKQHYAAGEPAEGHIEVYSSGGEVWSQV